MVPALGVFVTPVVPDRPGELAQVPESERKLCS